MNDFFLRYSSRFFLTTYDYFHAKFLHHNLTFSSYLPDSLLRILFLVLVRDNFVNPLIPHDPCTRDAYMSNLTKFSINPTQFDNYEPNSALKIAPFSLWQPVTTKVLLSRHDFWLA